MKRLYLVFGLFALTGFVASVLVHLAALSGIDVAEQFPWVWSLHGGIFVVFVPYAILNRRKTGARQTWDMWRSELQPWTLFVATGLFAYAFLNFFLFIDAGEGGNPTIRDGKYLLLNHGTLIRELTLAQYSALRANEVRGFSGHWMLLYFIPLAYFLFKKEKPATMSDRDRTISNGGKLWK